MSKINPFTDGRKIPEVSINVKVKVDTETTEEATNWNKVFGYLMRKPRTKVEFLNIIDLRKFALDNVFLEDLHPYLKDDDYQKLKLIEEIFDKKLTQDVKAFVLSILRVKPEVIQSLSSSL